MILDIRMNPYDDFKDKIWFEMIGKDLRRLKIIIENIRRFTMIAEYLRRFWNDYIIS